VFFFCGVIYFYNVCIVNFYRYFPEVMLIYNSNDFEHHGFNIKLNKNRIVVIELSIKYELKCVKTITEVQIKGSSRQSLKILNI